MKTTPALLQERLRIALEGISFGDVDVTGVPVDVTQASDARFGDYQSNVAMVLAKRAKMNPRALAEGIRERFDGSGICSSLEIAGAGFLNFRLESKWVRERVEAMRDDARLAVPEPPVQKKIIVDFSSPNVAKPMHVGHIRSTILGDALARIAEFYGHSVVRDNHIGDWGTQFGMLLVGWKTILDTAALERDPLGEMERIYKIISAKCKEDTATMDAARQELVRRMDSYQLEHRKLFHKVIKQIEDRFIPIVIRHAIPGLAIVNSEDPVFDDPIALAMVIDIFAERGYRAIVNVNRAESPESVDLKTGRITCSTKRIYRFQIRFQGSEIRRGGR